MLSVDRIKEALERLSPIPSAVAPTHGDSLARPRPLRCGHSRFFAAPDADHAPVQIGAIQSRAVRRCSRSFFSSEAQFFEFSMNPFHEIEGVKSHSAVRVFKKD